MAGKLKLLIGFGAGYVLGARAGRERYDQIMSRVADVRSNPKVQETASHVRDVATEKAVDLKDTVTDKVNEKVHGADTPKADSGNGTGPGGAPGGDNLAGMGTAPVTPDPR